MKQENETLLKQVVAFVFGFLVCLAGCWMFSPSRHTKPTPSTDQEQEWVSWPSLELKPNEEEEQLILPFLKGRQTLQTALEDWFRDNSADIHTYVDFLEGNSSLSVDIEELFECKKNTHSECLKFPYHLYQIGCESDGCFYFFSRQHGKAGSTGDGEYFINAFMDEQFRWKINCYSFINPDGAADFCNYLERKWNL